MAKDSYKPLCLHLRLPEGTKCFAQIIPPTINQMSAVGAVLYLTQSLSNSVFCYDFFPSELLLSGYHFELRTFCNFSDPGEVSSSWAIILPVSSMPKRGLRGGTLSWCPSVFFLPFTHSFILSLINMTKGLIFAGNCIKWDNKY